MEDDKRQLRSIPKIESDQNRMFEETAPYRIRVQGHLDDSWSQRLGGMVLTRAFTGNNQPMTILIGRLDDQAALSGVLNALYNKHLSIFSVELLGDGAGDLSSADFLSAPVNV